MFNFTKLELCVSISMQVDTIYTSNFLTSFMLIEVVGTKKTSFSSASDKLQFCGVIDK